MAKYEVDINGTKYEVDAPDEQSLGIAVKQLQEQAPSQTSTAGDIAKSAGSGFAQGAMDLLGTPGTISDALNTGFGAALKGGYKLATGVGNYLQGEGFTPEAPAEGSFFAGNAVPASVASGANIRENVSDLTGGATEYQPQTTAGEYAQTGASFVPGAVAFGGVSPANIARYGILPGVASEGAGQATEGTAAEPYARVAAALLAPALPNLGARVISPMGGRISPERGALNDIMKREGIDLTAGQQTGSKALKYRESQMGGGAAQNFTERQGEQFTAAIMKRVGSNATRATPEAVQEAGQRIGGMFDDLASRNNVIPDPKFSADLGDTLRGYVANTNPSSRIPIIENKIADLVADAAKGQISGRKYQQVASEIGEKIRGAKGEELEAFQGIRSALDDAMERSIAATNPGDLGLWKEARNSYRNLLVVEKAVTGAGEAARHGLISPQQLRGAVTQIQGRRNFARGQGDFADLARAGEGTMAPLPDSGTPGRIGAMMVPGAVGGATGAGISTALGLGPLPGVLAGAAIPAIAGRAALTGVGRKYLANQLISGGAVNKPGIASVIQALISRGGQ